MVVLKDGDLTSDEALKEKLAKEHGMKVLYDIIYFHYFLFHLLLLLVFKLKPYSNDLKFFCK